MPRWKNSNWHLLSEHQIRLDYQDAFAKKRNQKLPSSTKSVADHRILSSCNSMIYSGSFLDLCVGQRTNLNKKRCKIFWVSRSVCIRTYQKDFVNWTNFRYLDLLFSIMSEREKNWAAMCRIKIFLKWTEFQHYRRNLEIHVFFFTENQIEKVRFRNWSFMLRSGSFNENLPELRHFEPYLWNWTTNNKTFLWNIFEDGQIFKDFRNRKTN